jgi:arsenite/tail-anchored protein-transporting ATPase
VGKTTCAAARAVIEAARGARVLLASTDPAHSLGDALAVRLASSPRTIDVSAARADLAAAGRSSTRSRGSLHAVELDARRAFASWLARHRGSLGDVLEHGTWLDRSDVDALLDLPLPGIDELAGLLEIARLATSSSLRPSRLPSRSSRNRDRAKAGPLRLPSRRSSNRDRAEAGSTSAAASADHYDIVVVDTAPTGHTMRLLASPDAVVAVAHVLDDLQEEHRIVRDRFAGVRRLEAADRLIASLAGQAQGMVDTLRDHERTTFHWVTLAEMLSLAESDDGIAAIEQLGMRVAEVIVNRVLSPSPACRVCDIRRQEEQRVVAALARRFGATRRIRMVPAASREPRGVAALAQIGRTVSRGSRPSAARDAAGHQQQRGRIVLSLSKGQPVVAAESLAPFRDAALLFVGGKGGVGKTTIAAGAALRLARADPARRMLLLSTDPAHSLADVFDVAPGAFGDEPRTIPRGPANLFVRELDAVKALAVRRTVLTAAMNEIASSFGAAAVRYRGAELMDLAPPGIDELFGILSFVEASESYRLIVVDMAPTGHALRLLEQPDAARQWVQALLRVMLKYRSLARPGELAQELVTLSKAIRDLQALILDGSRTHVVAVTRAAEVPRLETERLLADLRRLKLVTPAIVVNALTLGPGRCARCRGVAAAERSQLTALRRRGRVGSRRCAIIQTPLAAPPPRGITALEEWATHWISAGSVSEK